MAMDCRSAAAPLQVPDANQCVSGTAHTAERTSNSLLSLSANSIQLE